MNKPILKRLTHNWVIKLLCLVLAFAVWQGVRENTNYETVISNIPMKVVAEHGYAVRDLSSDVVSIRFRGTRQEINLITRDQVLVEVNVSERSGHLRQTVKLTPHNVRTPSRASVVRFYPPQITLKLDREVERVLPVNAVVDGTLPQGIQFKNAICDPKVVRLRGAEKLLLDLKQVDTSPINLEGRYASFKTHVEVAASGEPWEVTPERVSVKVNLSEQADTRKIENRPVRCLLHSGDVCSVRVEPENVNVILSGTSNNLAKVNVSDVVAYIDCADLGDVKNQDVSVSASVPPNVRVERIDPPVVKAVIKNR